MDSCTSFEKYKEMFCRYADAYDKNDGRVALKIIHTEAVVNIMEQLCARLNLPEHTVRLALICAQFHDIGRFEQLKQYDTFLDHLSVDHALLSCRILAENHMLEDLTAADKKSVLTAIANHNKLEIDPAVILDAQKEKQSQENSSETAVCQEARERLILCRLLRDADKCDIFRVFATDDMMDVVGASDEEVARETVTPAVLNAVRSHICVDKQIRKTYLDFWVSFLCFFFDMNYPETIAIAKRQGYYRIPFDRTQFEKSEARSQVQEILEIIEAYIDSRTGEVPSVNDTVPPALRQFFADHHDVALAFSGGTDSAYLLYAAGVCGANVSAYYMATPFQPAFELEDARRLAKSLKARLNIIPFDVLTVETVKKNPADRCYYCKNAIFNGILKAAKKDGFHTVIDGTNASDDASDRPGMRALTELRVLSPLRLCNITKKELREYSKKAGLFTWNKPAYACLATRIPTGTAIEKETLQRVEEAESALFSMGFSDFRVRILPGKKEGELIARLQLPESQLSHLLANRSRVLELLGPKFQAVLLDLEVRSLE